ncbi:MAG: adenine phosphoribosyltransferase [Draconibacterium sp.]
MNLKNEIREIPDYPKVGINFKDITTLIKNPVAFNKVVELVEGEFINDGITKVVGLEARGFIFGGAIAAKLNAGFVPVRKKGKLPSGVITESYQLEYGEDRIEIHVDSLNKNDVVLIHDDLLATGGTAFAALQMVKKLGVEKIYFSFLCDLEFIDTPLKKELMKHKTQVLVKYQ